MYCLVIDLDETEPENFVLSKIYEVTGFSIDLWFTTLHETVKELK